MLLLLERNNLLSNCMTNLLVITLGLNQKPQHNILNNVELFSHELVAGNS